MKSKHLQASGRRRRALGGRLAAILAVALLTAVSAAAQDIREQLRREAERSQTSDQQTQRVDPASWPDIVARVNGEEVQRIELMTQADLMRRQVMQAGGGDPGTSVEFYRQVLQGLVGELLVFQHVRAQQGDASEAEIDQALDGMRSQFPDPAAFEAELERQGSSVEKMRRQLHRALTIQKYIDEKVAPAVTVDEEVKRAFYEQNKGRLEVPEQRHVRHIMLRASRDAAEDVRARANGRAKALRARVGDGSSFAELAREHSEDNASREAGGDLGWIVRSGARPEFEAAAFSLTEPGQVSDVVETAAGFHIVQLLEVRPGRVRTYEETAEQIEQLLKNGEIQRRIQAQVDSLTASAQVEIGI